jgi:hypothetical protein
MEGVKIMDVKDISRRISVIFLSVVLTAVFMPGIFRNQSTVRAADTETTFEYTLDAEAQTATLTKCTVPEGGRTDVEIPSTTTKDGTEYTVTAVANDKSVFSNNVTSVTVPKTVINLGWSYLSFKGVPNLKAIHVAEGNTAFMDDRGVLYSADGTKLYLFPVASDLSEYTIPDTVKTVNGSVFKGARNLKYLEFGGGISNTGGSVAEDCPALEEVTISSGCKTIDGNAFDGCTRLRSVHIADSVATIQAHAFSNTALETITLPGSLRTVYLGAFSGSKLKTINIPASVTRLQCDKLTPSPFHGCRELESIEVDPNNAAYCSVDGVLFDKNKKVLYVYPAAKKDTSYKLPDTANNGVWDFDMNPYLETLDLNNNVAVRTNACFEGCTALKEFKTAESNKYLSAEDGVLFNIYNGNEIVKYPQAKDGDSYAIPETVTTAATYAFNGCSKLKELSIPAGIGLTQYNESYFPTTTFAGCSSLQAIHVDDGNEIYHSEEGALIVKINGAETLICYPADKPDDTFVVPSKVSVITAGAFTNAAHLKKLAIPAAVETVEDGALSGSTAAVIYTAADSEAAAAAKKNEWTYVTDNTAPTIGTTALNDAMIDVPYRAQLKASCDMKYKWAVADGRLPDGLTLSSNGLISGTPTEAGSSAFTISAYNGHEAVKSLTLKVETVEEYKASAVNILKKYAARPGCTQQGNALIKDVLDDAADGIGRASTSDEISAWIKVAKNRIDDVADNLTMHTVRLSAEYTFNGSAVKPSVTVSGLTKGTDYTIAYKNNTGVGTATAVISGKGSCRGTVSRTFRIVPAKTRITKVKAGKKKVKVSCKKLKGGVRYQFAVKKKGAKTWKTYSSAAAVKTIAKLTAKKQYTVKVRGCKKVGGKTYCGAWSNVKTVRIK